MTDLDRCVVCRNMEILPSQAYSAAGAQALMWVVYVLTNSGLGTLLPGRDAPVTLIVHCAEGGPLCWEF